MRPIQMLNQRQFAWMVTVILLSGGLVTLPKVLSAVAKQDSWFCQFCGIIYALVVALFFYDLARRFPGKNLFEISFHVAGRYAGGVMNLMVLGYLWLILVRDTRAFADFLNSTLLVRTPEEISIFLFICVLIYFGRSGVEVTARVTDIVLPLFLFFVWGEPLMLANEFSFERTEPLLGQGIAAVLKGNLLPLGWYGDMLVVGAFLHTVASAKQLHTAMRHGILLAGGSLTMIFFMCITVLGTTVSERTMYPSYTLVEQIHITDYLDRVELLMFSVWLPTYILKVCFIFHAILNGLASFTRSGQNATVYAGQVGWFCIITTFLAFRNVTEVFNYGNYGAIFQLTVLQLPVFLVILFCSRRSKFKKQHRQQTGGANQQKQEQPQQQRQEQAPRGLLGRMQTTSPKMWMWMTNGFVAGCAAAVVAGAWFGRDMAWIGRICAILYTLCKLLEIVSSYMEMWRTKMELVKKSSGSQDESKTA